MGCTKVESNMFGVALSLLRKAKRNGVDLVLPADVACGDILVDDKGVVGDQKVPEAIPEEDEGGDDDDEEEEGEEKKEAGEEEDDDDDEEEEEEEDD